jgi:DNA-binding NarL/FixJ family response regulator
VRLDPTAAILILQSEPPTAIDIEEMLRAAGFAHVASVSDAITRLDGQSPQVVILDLYALDGSTAAFAGQFLPRTHALRGLLRIAQLPVRASVFSADALWLRKSRIGLATDRGQHSCSRLPQ